jgi:outer membrane protein assembly factor BamB
MRAARAACLVFLGFAACARASSTTRLPGFYDLSLAVVGGAERPSWQTPADGMTAAFVVPVEGRGVLVAETEMVTGLNQHARMPEVTAISLLDARTGEALWTAHDLAIPYADASLLATEPVIAVRSAKGVLGLDPRSGRTLWSTDGSVGATAVRARLLFTTTKGADEVRAIDLADGSVRWSSPSPCGARDSAALEIVGDRLYLAAEGLCVFGFDGRNLGVERALGEVISLARLPDGVVAADATGAVVRWSGGRAAWSARVPAGVRAVADSPRAILVSGESSLTAIGAADGHVIWRAPMAGALQGPATAVADRVVYSTSSGIFVLDAATGSPLASVARPAAFARGGLGDRIVAFDSHAAIVGETGLLAVAVGPGRDGQVLWQLDVRGVDGATYQRRIAAVERRTRTVGVYMSPEDAAKLSSTAQLSNQLAANTLAQGRALDLRVQQLSSKTGPLSSQERVELRVDSQFARAQAAMGLAQSLVGFAASAFAAAVQMNLMAMERRSSALLQHTLQLHRQAIQGDHYVRPIAWTFGQGVLIVDLKSGKWREVITAPGEPFVEDFYLPSSPAAFDPRSQRLYTIALGGEPNAWRTREDYPGLVVGRRSRLAYDLPAASWRPPEAYGRPPRR